MLTKFSKLNQFSKSSLQSSTVDLQMPANWDLFNHLV